VFTVLEEVNCFVFLPFTINEDVDSFHSLANKRFPLYLNHEQQQAETNWSACSQIFYKTGNQQ